jgi:hypothetical protein
MPLCMMDNDASRLHDHFGRWHGILRRHDHIRFERPSQSKRTSM